MGFFFPINRVKIFMRGLSCFLEFFTAKILHCSMGDDVSFIFRSVEEGEGEDGDDCCTLDVEESFCQRVLVLMMGSSSKFGSCDKAQLSGWKKQ